MDERLYDEVDVIKLVEEIVKTQYGVRGCRTFQPGEIIPCSQSFAIEMRLVQV